MDNNENNIKKCSGDCMQCSFQQRAYCAAQIARNNVDALVEIRNLLAVLTEKIESLGNASAEVFNPMGETVEPPMETPEQQFDDAQQAAV